MVKMIATKAQTYDNKTIEAGEEFEVEDRFVGTLQSLARATLKDEASTKVKPTTTKPAEEKPEKEKPAAKKEPEPKAKYRTRDMRARR